MTEQEYAAFYRTSFEHQTEELMREEELTREEAESETQKELDEMLPNGQVTPDNYLFSIKKQRETAGYLWFMTEMNEDVKQAFLCDILVYEQYRRNGCGEAALAEMERLAKGMDCRKCVMFVDGNNHAAKSLYEKCGYEALREHSYGYFMKKTIM